MKNIAILALLFLTACTSAPTSKYVVSEVVYSFDTTNPSMITSVAFDLDRPAATVKVGIGDSAWNLQTCTSAEPFTHWSCPLSGVIVMSSMSSLRVVIE
jgi:hypothetical protein